MCSFLSPKAPSIPPPEPKAEVVKRAEAPTFGRGNKALAAALSAITAAVVGVILNLVIWFSLHVIFGEVNEKTIGVIHLYIPVWNTIEWAALFISAGALVATLKYNVGMIPTLLVSGAVGIVYFFSVNIT